MPTLYDRETGRAVEVPDQHVAQALASGRLGVKKGSVGIISPDGKGGTVPSNRLADAIQAGYRMENKDEEAERIYGNRTGEAFIAGAARGLTMGISDLVLTKGGFVDNETFEGLRRGNPTASPLGEVVGLGASMVLPGGQVGALTRVARSVATPARMVTGVGATVARRTEANFIKYLTERKATKALAKQGHALYGDIGLAEKALARSGALATSGAVEGSLYGVGQAITESALGDPELMGETFMAEVGPLAIAAGLGGALVGGTLGGASVFGTRALTKTTKHAAGKLEELGVQVAELDKTKIFRQIGVTPKALKKLGDRKNAMWLDEAEEVLQTELTADGSAIVGKNLRETAKNIQEVVDMHGARIGTFIDDMDVAVRELELAGGGRITPDVQAVAKKLNKEATEWSRFPSWKAGKSELDTHANAFLENDYWTFIDAQEQRNALSKAWRSSGKIQSGSADDARRTIERVINDELEGKAEMVLQKLGQEETFEKFMHSKKVYRSLRDLATLSDDAAIRDAGQNMFWRIAGYASKGAIQRIAWGTTVKGALVFGAAGAAARVAFGTTGRELAQKAGSLGAIQKTAENLGRRISLAVEKLEHRPAKGPSLSTKVLQQITGERDEEKAAKSFTLEMFRLQAQPELITARISTSFGHIEKDAPQIIQAAATTAAKAVSAAIAILPTPPPEVLRQPQAAEWRMSQEELATAKNTARTLQDPVTVMEDLIYGAPDIQQIAIAKSVYPKLFESFQMQVVEMIGSMPTMLSWQSILRLQPLLGRELDALLSDRAIARAQEIYGPPQEEMTAGMGKGSQDLKKDNRIDKAAESHYTRAQQLEMPA